MWRIEKCKCSIRILLVSWLICQYSYLQYLRVRGITAYLVINMAFKGSELGALAAALLVSIVLGSLYTFAAISPYISSFLYYRGSSTSSIAFSLVFSLIIVMEAIGLPIEVVASKYLSNRLLCLVSVVGLGTSIFIASFMETFMGMVAFMGIVNGIFIGFGYLPPIKNAYKHLPHRKGLCTGVCLSGFGLGTILFNYVIVSLINPNNEEIDHDTKRFSRDIANNVPFALKIFAGGVIVLGVIGSLFIVPPKKKHVTLLIASKAVAQSEVQDSRAQEEIEESKLPIFTQFINKRGYLLTIHLLATCAFGMLVASNYKEIAFQLNQDFEKEDHLITIVGSIGGLANGLSRSVWGILFDKLSFRAITITMNVVLLIGTVTLLLAASNIYSYGAMVTIIYFCYGGSLAIFPTQTVRVFGEKIGTKIYSLVFVGIAMASILQFSLHYFIVEGFEDHVDGYFYCFIVFGGVQVCALLMSILVKYQYTCLEENLMGIRQGQYDPDFDEHRSESSKEITYLSSPTEPLRRA